MANLLAVTGKAIGWLLFLGIAYLSYHFIWKDSVPNLFYKGWATLQPTYAVAQLPIQPAVTSVRIGSDVYQGTMYVVLDTRGVYFQRALLKPYEQALYIPYSRFELIAIPKTRRQFFGMGTFGIFRVDGIDIWLDAPYADQLIAHLTP